MKKNKNVVKETFADQVFLVIVHVLLVILLLVVLYPLVLVLSLSISDAKQIMAGNIWLLPKGINVDGYKAVFNNSQIGIGYLNTFIYTIAGTAINVVFTILAAYPLSRKDFYGRNLLMFLFTFTMLFNGGLIPTFLLIRDLGMLDTRWALLIPTALSVWNVIITRTYFQTTIPDDLYAAAEIDGCSDIRFISAIVIPLSAPIIAVITLFYAVQHWNEYFNALIYLTKQELYPLQIVLRNILIQNQIDAEMMMDLDAYESKENLQVLLKYSLIIVACAPILMIYPFIQKYFVKGVMIGSLKG